LCILKNLLEHCSGMQLNYLERVGVLQDLSIRLERPNHGRFSLETNHPWGKIYINVPNNPQIRNQYSLEHTWEPLCKPWESHPFQLSPLWYIVLTSRRVQRLQGR
jgi:hypothetical protein